MAVNTTTLLTLKTLLLQALGDYLTFATTTNIAANNSVISTTLRQYDNGRDGAFDDWWIYIDGTNNSGVARKTGSTTYATASGTLTVYGGVLAAEAAAVTCYLTRYEPAKIERALLRAIEEIYPTLHLKLDDTTLVTGNILPDASFEDWPTSSALTWYTASNLTLTKTSTAGKVINGTYSVYGSAGAANSTLYISSNSYPRLLDLQGQSVSVYVWVYPQKKDDATIIIDTVSTDGTTTQTLTSTTSCPAGYWTLLKLEDQALNDDLQEVKITFNVATSGQYCYFDDATLFGRNVKELLLPVNFRDGHVSLVTAQDTSNQSPACYDFNSFATMSRGRELRHDIVDEGSWRYLRLLEYYPDKYRLRLTGIKPLESLTADTGTITIDDERVNLLIEYAKIIFLERESKPISSEDVDRYTFELNRAYGRYQQLFHKHRMNRKAEYIL